MHDQKAKSISSNLYSVQPVILPKISRILPYTPDTTYFYILVPALSQEGAKFRAEWFMRRRTYGVRDIYATEAKRINLRIWEVEVVVMKSSRWGMRSFTL